MPSRPKPRAFTLVELLVAIAIIALLTSMLVPSLAQARVITLRVLCAENLRQVRTAMTMYLGDSGEVYPCAQDPVSASPMYWLWMGRGWRGLVAPYLGSAVNADSPSVLFCQADPAMKTQYESTSYAYSMSFYHTPAQIDSLNRAADTYSNPLPSEPQRPQDVAHPAEKVLIGEWTSNHAPLAGDKGWWCWEGSRNFLFADGRVLYLEATQIRPARDNLPDPNLTFGGVKGRDLP